MSKDQVYFTYRDSPIGRLLLAGSRAGLKWIAFPEGQGETKPAPDWQHSDEHFAEVIRQLDAYFKGELKSFDFPLALEGTAFQKIVWQELLKIPYGATTSYGELARRIGKPKAVRAVGAANGRNPIPIVVPCHRVIGSDGSLTGYGGGLQIKEFLLVLERRHICC